MKSHLALIPLVVAALVTGCASTNSADMVAMQDMAKQAMDRAAAAEAMAKQASSKADAANRNAAAAMEAARDAQACCQANTRRINRAFEQSMQK